MVRIVGLLLIIVGGAVAALNLLLYPRKPTRQNRRTLRGAVSTALFAAGVGLAMTGLKLAAADLAVVDLPQLPGRGGGLA